MKITFSERIKLYCQRTFYNYFENIFLVPLMITLSLFIWQSYIKSDSITLLNYIEIFMIATVVLHILFIMFRIRNLSYLLRDGFEVVDGKLINTRKDPIVEDYHGDDTPSARSFSYKAKTIGLFTGNIINIRGFNRGGSYRIKVQSVDGKYTTPWVNVCDRIIKNKDNYTFKVIIYKNEAITCLYKKQIVQ